MKIICQWGKKNLNSKAKQNCLKINKIDIFFWKQDLQ